MRMTDRFAVDVALFCNVWFARSVVAPTSLERVGGQVSPKGVSHRKNFVCGMFIIDIKATLNTNYLS